MPSTESMSSSAEQKEEKLPMPRVMEHIVLRQIAQGGEWHMEGGKEMEGLLMEEITVGKRIRLGAMGNTDIVEALGKGKREGEIVVTTKNSTYILKKF